jgi:peptide/nickel transport system permease protein
MTRREFGSFVGRRLVALVVILLVISFVVFLLEYLAPGNTVQLLLGNRPATPSLIAALRAKYHLDQPFIVQYWFWLRNAIHLNFGDSVSSAQPVTELIRSRMGVTLLLGGYGFVVAMLAGVPLGVFAALRQRGAVDRGIVGLSVVGVSAPAFVTGIFLLYFFAVELSWFPVAGPGSGTVDRLWHFTLPAIALAFTAMALVVKLTRAGMIRALEQDYIAFARARGLSARRVLVVYALRNALIPVVTGGGLILGYMLTGAVLVEVMFSLPGVGSLLVDAVNAKDIPVVQGITLVLAVMIVLVNLLTDILYRVIDPRVRFEALS